MQTQLLSTLAAKEIEVTVDHLEHEHACGTAMGPEDNKLSARLHSATNLPENLHDLILRKMFDNAEVIRSVEAVARHLVQVENVAVAYGLGTRIITAVKFQRRQGDID